MELGGKVGYSLHMTHTSPLVMLSALLAVGCHHTVRTQPPLQYVPPSGATADPPGQPRSQSLLKTVANLQPADARTADSGVSADKAERDRQVTDIVTSMNQILDAYFDFNAYRLRPDAIEAVTKAAARLNEYLTADPAIRLVIEGHCDERGSPEFNLALGDRRAESVREMLSQLGMDAARMTTISYGEARPDCGDATEACWQKNRRAHIRHER